MFAAEQGIPSLLTRHYLDLSEGSGLSDEVIRARGYVSVLGRRDLRARGFGERTPLPGLLLPLHAPDKQQPLSVYRPDKPLADANGKIKKYLLPHGAAPRLDCPPACLEQIGNPAVALYITEGQKKADALATVGRCAVALLGVWMFKGRNEHGGVTLLTDLDLIAWRHAATGRGRTVRIVFDSDAATNPQVRSAMERLAAHLKRRGAAVEIVRLPPGEGGAKVGVDDYLLTHTVAELEALVEAPEIVVPPAPPQVRLLDDPPPAMTRPLALVDGRAYAATWLWVEVTVTERAGKDGRAERLAEPPSRPSGDRFIVRDDGVIFGDGADPSYRPLTELPMAVALDFIPSEALLWRARGVSAYRAGRRPKAAEVVARVAAVFDRFMDFAGSLLDQPTMCLASAVISLATWFLPAYSVVGYPWPTGLPAPASPSGASSTRGLATWARSSSPPPPCPSCANWPPTAARSSSTTPRGWPTRRPPTPTSAP